ncbi:MAG TPA: MerR family transcriptional regulator [Ktedonobacteraceae bacterium]|nr:MerR family transcriptional regulator [Ktedonobacteraceae bacterium]
MVAANEEQQSAVDTDEQAPLYTIEQVATRTGMTKRTLRYYEEVGLLPPTGRTEGNYRRYSEADIERLERIKKLRDLLGFSLNDIRNLLEADDERGQIKEAYRQETEAAAKIAQLERADELLREQLHIIEQKITGLEQMRRSILAKLEQHERTRNDLRAKK